MSDKDLPVEDLETVETAPEVVAVEAAKPSKPRKPRAPKAPKVEEPVAVEATESEAEVIAEEEQPEPTAEEFIGKFAKSQKEFQRMVSSLNAGKSVAVDLAAGKLIMDNHPFYKQGASYLTKRYGPQVVVVNNLKRQK